MTSPADATSKRPRTPPTTVMPSVTKSPDSAQAAKKQRHDEATIVDYPFTPELRTAIDINNAIKLIYQVPALGFCPSKSQQFIQEWSVDTDSKEISESERDRYTIPQPISDLKATFDEFPGPVATGKFNFSFNLKITRPGCEYDGPISHDSKDTDKLLPVWFEHAAISGFGDMKTLETRVDDEVRSAREIPATEFSVDTMLLEQIQKEWETHFLPRNVRTQPYKIHIYGDRGHFKPHRDTPEKDLVGTFLVGLGDTTGYEGKFHIKKMELTADSCSWVAFHPDVPHHIDKILWGHRAVIAFKIFRHEQSDDELPAKFEIRIKDVFSKMQPPYGIFLNHQYCMGTSHLNGFDHLLLSCARSCITGHVYLLPVVTRFWGEHFWHAGDDDERDTVTADVYPFSNAHVDYILGRNDDEAKKGIEWLRGWEDIPFYSLDFPTSVLTWKEEEPDGANYIGNEADSFREDSLYLAYSLLVLPKKVLEEC